MDAKYNRADFSSIGATPSQTPNYASSNDPNVLRNPKFLGELREYFRSKSVPVSTMSDEDLIDRFYSDNTWADFNTVSAIGSAVEAGTANKEEKERLNRLQTVWRQLPNFWQQGGRGFGAAAADAAGAIIADPINLIPGVNAYAKGALAARGAVAAGRSGLGAGVRAGAKSGAISEGIISGAQEGIVNTASQARDVQLGLADGFSGGQLAGAVGIGSVLGSGVGGLIGAGAGTVASRTAADQVDAARFIGASDEQIAGMSNAQAEQATELAATRTGPYMPSDVAASRATEPEVEAPPLTKQEELEAKWKAEADKIEELELELQEKNTNLRADDLSEETEIIQSQARIETASKLKSMAARLKLEEEQITQFGGTNDVATRRKHDARVKDFQQDYSDYRALLDALDGTGDIDVINARLDGIINRGETSDAPTTGTEAATEPPTDLAAEGADADEGVTASPRDGSDVSASTETKEVAPPVEEYQNPKYRSPKQEKAMKQILDASEASLSEYDISVFIARGELSVTKDGVLKQSATKELRKLAPAKKGIEKNAETIIPETVGTETAPSAEIPTTRTDTLRGQALYAGIDPDLLTPPKRSKTGKVTKAQVNKAVSGRAADAEPDPKAAQVNEDLREMLELIGPEEDITAVRAAVSALSRASKSEENDLLSLLEYILEAEDGVTVGSDKSVEFTKTELKRIKRRATSIRKSQPGMSSEMATSIARGEVLENRTVDTTPIRGTGESIEAAANLPTAGLNSAGRIQGFLRRGTRISKGSEYTTTPDMRVKRGEMNFEEALAEARRGMDRGGPEKPLEGGALKRAEEQYEAMLAKGVPAESARSIAGLNRGTIDYPTIIEYSTQTGETIMTRSGKIKAKKGGIAYADGYTKRAYDSMELALEARGETPTKKINPAVEETMADTSSAASGNLKKLLDEFGADPAAFRKALEAVRKGDAAPKKVEKLPLVRGSKLVIAKHKTRLMKDGGADVRMIDPKQADTGKNVDVILGKDALENWDIKYADRERFTNNKSRLRELYEATPDDTSDPAYGSPEGQRVDAGYANSLGRPMNIIEASLAFVEEISPMTPTERAAVSYGLRLTDAKKLDEVTVDHLVVADMSLASRKWSGNLETHEAIGSALESINGVLNRVAPFGVQMPNARRVDSIKSLEKIFSGASSDELKDARRFMTALGGDRSVGPEFKTNASMAGQAQYLYSKIKPGAEYDFIKVEDMTLRQGVEFRPDTKTGLSAPRISILYHEVAHWAYRNILTAEDRAEFWKYANQFYKKEGGVDANAIGQRISRYPDIETNGLDSPQELFANQFEVWAARKQGGIVTNENYWKRIVKYVQAIFDRYVSGTTIDPELEPLFAKILPEHEQGAFGLGRDGVPSTTAGKTYDRRLKEIALNKDDMLEAMQADSPEGVILAAGNIVDMLLTLAPRVHIAMKRGTTGTLAPLIPMRNMIRQRIDDMSEIIAGKPFDFDAYDKGVLPRWMTDEGLTEMSDPTDAADMLRDFYFNGYNGTFEPKLGYPVAKSGKPINRKYTSVERLIDLMNIKLEAAYKRSEAGDLPPSAKPELDGELVPSDTPSAVVRKAKKKKARVEKAADASATSTTKTSPKKRLRRDVKKSRTVDPAFAESLKEKSARDLRKLYVAHRGTERGDQVAFELVRSIKAEPLPPKQVAVPKEVRAMKGDELENMLFEALANKKTKVADQAINEMQRRVANKMLKKDGHPTIQPVILKRSFLDNEVNDNIGLASSDGIPPAARASVRELLSYVTHRDPEVQYTARTMAYRMMNLMNKTTRGALGEANVMSTADLARLANTDPNTVGTAAFADFRSPEFNKMRSDLRRMSIALTKGKSNPFDVMHEIGHVVMRSGAMSGDEIAAVREAYTLANDVTKNRVQSAYATKYAGRTESLDDLLAEEWFAEGLSNYMAERVSKGDILEAALDGNIGNLRMRNTFSRALDKMVEYISYVVNGLVGRNDIKQQYRRLFLFGDMFENAGNAPMSGALRQNKFVSASNAADVVADHIVASPQARLAKIRKFTENGLSYDGESGRFTEFYHGTPSGGAFNRASNPDVVLEGSRRGQYGPGVYLTRSAAVASEVYSRKPTLESVVRQIQDLRVKEQIDEDTASMMTYAAKDLSNTRTQISKLRRKYSDFAQFNQPATSQKKLRERLDYMIEEEAELNDFLSENGLNIEPMVIPTFVKVRNPANFQTSKIYMPNEQGIPDALPQMFVDNAKTNPNLKAEEVEAFAQLVSQRRLTGRELYDSMVDMYVRSGRERASAQAEINGVLEENGYDGILSTHNSTLGIEGTDVMPNGETYEASVTQFEALTVFDSSNVKHVDADEFDDFDSRLFYRASEAFPRGTLGSVGEAILNRNIEGTKSINPASLGEILEGDGVSPPMTSALMSMIRGRKLDVKEEQAMRKTSPFFFLQSQSERMNDLGANWVARWYKENFPNLHQKFATKYFPIHHSLRDLPDADGKVRAWARRASAGIKQKQPESYDKIVRALRRGVDATGKESRQVTALTAKERAVWNQIRNAFVEERREMIAEGMYVGDRGPNYLPQVWNKEKIRGNKEEFLAKMQKYFKVEKTAKGVMDYTDEQAADFADGLFSTLAEDGADGVFVPIQGGSRNPKFDNVDFSRIIELEKYPSMLNELEPFLEGDLEFLLVKYFEGSSRRITHAKQMGINNHAFYDYILAADAGKEGMVRLLTTPKEFRKDIRALSEDGYPEYATLTDTNAMPFEGNEGGAAQFIDEMIRVHKDQGIGASRKMLEVIAPKDADGNISLAYKRRSDAILGALDDFGGQKVQWQPSDFEFMENAMRVAMKKPMTGTGSRGMMSFSRGMRSFNSITLLGFTTLTSLGDLALPIIRSGSFTDWAKGLHKWKTDPEYAQFIHDTGVAMENIVHERMVYMYGAVDGKLTNAFFNATMLTPWTDMNRSIAGATGYEAFKTMQKKANRYYKEGAPIGDQPVQYKTAARFLNNYGLGEFLPTGAKKELDLGDRKLMGNDEQISKGIIKFADDAIFQPNPNDIPLWAQTPWGSMIFQLKSFPLMMTRLGGHVIKEFGKGNVKPLMYFATLGPAFGMGALAAKDIIQMRGGDDERSPELRKRNALKALGYDDKIHGNEQDFLGWYMEGMLMMGGLGLLGDIMHSAVTQVDNGAYGKVRLASTFAGPSFGTFMSAVDVGAGAKDSLLGGDNSNAKERTAVREIANRVPVVGGIRRAREGIVDGLVGEPRSARDNKNPWQTSWGSGWK